MSENIVRQNIARYDFYVNFISKYPDTDNRNLDFRRILRQIQDEALNTLRVEMDSEITREISSTFDGVLETRITINRGSIIGAVVLVLATGVSAFDFASKYKDFHESLVLIRQQIRNIINKVLSRIVETTPYFYTVETDLLLYPIISREARPFRYAVTSSQIQSTGFFWYLLIINILLIGIVCLLVYSAVMRTYFVTS